MEDHEDQMMEDNGDQWEEEKNVKWGNWGEDPSCPQGLG